MKTEKSTWKTSDILLFIKTIGMIILIGLAVITYDNHRLHKHLTEEFCGYTITNHHHNTESQFTGKYYIDIDYYYLDIEISYSSGITKSYIVQVNRKDYELSNGQKVPCK